MSACVSLHSACTGIHITTENMNVCQLYYSLRIATIIYTTIYLGNWFPFPDPIERRFFSKDGHQWNLDPPKTWICNIMNIFMTLDQTANEKNKKMVLCKFIQSRRTEMTRDTGSWITMNHVHAACIAHTVYSWPHGGPCVRSICGNYYVHCTCVGNSLFKTLCRQSSLFMR